MNDPKDLLDDKRITDALGNWLDLQAPSSAAPKQDPTHARALKRARVALKRAETAARRGDAAEAKRWSEIARNMAEAARSLAETQQPYDPEQEEAMRNEVRARLSAYAEAEGELARWETRREIWEEMAALARETGAPMPPPMPPRPPHWSDSLPQELRDRLHSSTFG